MTIKNTQVPQKQTNSVENDIGTLYIVATPIGNLGDITQRAIETLKQADKILAEDTRNTRKLLTHFGIQGNLQALHEHNEQQKIGLIKDYLDAGENIALVSDAGTPLISDPGYHLVNDLANAGYTITPIPGVSAIITALSIAGLPTNRFSFEGFLPAKSTGRDKMLQANAKEARTQVYYESCHRIIPTIQAMAKAFGDNRSVVLARELTKMYEQVYRGDLKSLQEWIVADPTHQKGEFVLMVAAYEEDDTNHEEITTTTEDLLKILIEELPIKQAASLAANITGQKKNALYRRAMALKEDGLR